MHRLSTILALPAGAIAALTMSAAAMPLAPDMQAVAAVRSVPPHLLLVGGCHRDIRHHYVPEWKTSTTHLHGENCRPIPFAPSFQDQQPRDCHRDARTHYVPGYGRVRHRHSGGDCRIRIIRRSSEPALR